METAHPAARDKRRPVDRSAERGRDHTRPCDHERPHAAGRDSAWQLTAQQVFLKLKKPPTSDIQVAEAHAEGHAQISQMPPESPAESQTAPDPGPMSLAGAHVELVNEGGAHQVVTITGAPVLLRRGKYLLECRQLQLDRVTT